MKYLKDKEYYGNLYDKFTIERCKEMEKRSLETEPEEYKGLSLKKRKKLAAMVTEVYIYYFKGDRYAQKSQTVFEWMEKDRRRDEKLDSSAAPEHIRCSNCHSIMDYESKDLYWGSEDHLRALFLYRCKNCGKGKAIFDDGEEYKSKPNLCPECNLELKTTYNRKVNKIDTIYTCLKQGCRYKKTDTLDLSKKEEKEVIDPNYEKGKQRFLMTEKEGLDYVQHVALMKELEEHQKERAEREKHKDLYDKVAQLKKLTLYELEKLLTEYLEKEGYVKLNFAPPKKDKDVIVDFTILESKPGQSEYDSRNKLKRLINKTLIDTNWRLMSYGIEYRLGILSGSLRGYEKEKDLLEFVKK